MIARRGRRSTRPRSISEFANPARHTSGRSAARSTAVCNTTPSCRHCQAPSRRRPGLVLTLHGAGVEGIGQAECYSPQARSAHRRTHQSPPVRLRLGRLGPARCHRGARAGPAVSRNRPAADLPDRPFDGRARHLAPGCDLSRPVRRDRSERGLDQHVVVRRSKTRRRRLRRSKS